MTYLVDWCQAGDDSRGDGDDRLESRQHDHDDHHGLEAADVILTTSRTENMRLSIEVNNCVILFGNTIHFVQARRSDTIRAGRKLKSINRAGSEKNSFVLSYTILTTNCIILLKIPYFSRGFGGKFNVF